MKQNKHSFGIALVRFSNRMPELLMIKKRYTYQFADFVMGNYKNSDDELQEMFCGMTFQEKLDILYCNFNLVWYRMWLFWPLDSPNFDRCCSSIGITNSKEMKTRYYSCKLKYESVMKNVARIRNLINKSSNADLIWEIPKGRKNDMETNADAAIREFTEETLVPLSKIWIMWHLAPLVESFSDHGVNYTNTFYIAIQFEKHKSTKPAFNAIQTSEKAEVEDIRWMNLNDVKSLHLEAQQKKRLINLCTNIFSTIRANTKFRGGDYESSGRF